MDGMPQGGAPRGARPDWFVLALLAASLGLNVWLGVTLRRGPAPAAPAPALQAGDAVPALEVVDARRQPASLRPGPDGRPLVLYVYTRSCPWCLKNRPAVEALVVQRSDSYRFAGLCLGSPEECFAEGGPDLPAYSGLKPEVARRLGLVSVPQTIVVSPDARVARVWRGAYTGAQRAEVESFFGLALPGEGAKGR
jgi:hypothetical protein